MNIWEQNFFVGSHDIEVYVEEISYNLHKNILYCSPVLRYMIIGLQEKESNNKIKIDAINTTSWILFLKYLYTTYTQIYTSIFEINIINQDFKPEKLSFNEKFDLYEATDYFSVSILKNSMITFITDDILTYFDQNNYEQISIIIDDIPHEILLFLFNVLQHDSIRVIRIFGYCKNNPTDNICQSKLYLSLLYTNPFNTYDLYTDKNIIDNPNTTGPELKNLLTKYKVPGMYDVKTKEQAYILLNNFFSSI